jgi:hypothetical protein
MKSVSEVVNEISHSLREAGGAHEVICLGGQKVDRDHQKRLVAYFMELAFVQTLFFLEQRGATRTYGAVRVLHKEAKNEYSKTAITESGDPYLYWAEKLDQYLRAFQTTLGESAGPTITKELTQILAETQYVITDRKVYGGPPANEADVHRRIEAILRCVFPDIRNKPKISKPIRNFEPDTGLPSIRTLIEYKFISSERDAKRVATELLTDTRGYVSKDWDTFVYVIYETTRVRPEHEWNAFLHAAAVGENSRAVVISGEPIPRVSRGNSVTGNRRSAFPT